MKQSIHNEELLQSIHNVKDYLESSNCKIPKKLIYEFWRIINYSEHSMQRDESIKSLNAAFKTLGVFDVND